VGINTLYVEVITSFAKLWSLEREWRELETACATDLPFQSWEWSTGWWSHLREDAATVRDSLRVCIVRTENWQLLGIALLMITERPSLGPIRLRILQFIGADPNITELRSMLCLPAFEEDCYDAVQEHLSASAKEWDWIAWEGVQPHIGNELQLVDRFSSVEEKSALVLDLAPTWKQFKDPLGRNIKQSLRKCYNSLKRDGLTYRLEVVEQSYQIDSALDESFRLHTARANLDGTVNHPDIFLQPRIREFLIEVCQRLAKRRVVRIFQLWVDDKWCARAGVALLLRTCRTLAQ